MSAATPKTKKSPKAPAAHPPYREMIGHAIKDLKERNGSSRQAISKYIKSHYKVDEKADSLLRRSLVAGVKSGNLMQTKGIGASGSFKMAPKHSNKPKDLPKPKKSPAPQRPKTPKIIVKTKKPAPTKKSTDSKNKTVSLDCTYCE